MLVLASSYSGTWRLLLMSLLYLFQRAKNWASSLDDLDTPIETYSDYCPTVAAGRNPVHGFTSDKNCISAVLFVARFSTDHYLEECVWYMNNFTYLKNSLSLWIDKTFLKGISFWIQLPGSDFGCIQIKFNVIHAKVS